MDAIYLVAVAAIVGAILVGTSKWLGSVEPWDVRKFAATIVTAVITGAGISLAYSGDTVGPREVVMAFLAGAGVDYSRTAISSAIAARANK